MDALRQRFEHWLARKARARAHARTERLFRRRYGDRAQLVFCGPPGREDAAARRWQRIDVDRPRLDVVAVTYRQPDALASFLQSMVCQTLRNFRVRVIHDGADAATEAVVRRFDAADPGTFGYEHTEDRHNDWGHTLRDVGLARAEHEFVLITNGDNYYVPRALEYAFGAIDRHGLDLVMWDMVHSHHEPAGRPQEAYERFETRPLHWHADIGCFIARTSMARAVGFKDRSFTADGIYLESLIDAHPGIRVGKVDKVLLVHN